MTDTQSNTITKKELLIQDKEVEAVKRLRMFYRQRPELVFQYGGSDENFIQWLSDVLKVIRVEEMQSVKKILENDPAFQKEK